MADNAATKCKPSACFLPSSLDRIAGLCYDFLDKVSLGSDLLSRYLACQLRMSSSSAV
jgi:hypothetical protein